MRWRDPFGVKALQQRVAALEEELVEPERHLWSDTIAARLGRLEDAVDDDGVEQQFVDLERQVGDLERRMDDAEDEEL
jgi:hypothetical protein